MSDDTKQTIFLTSQADRDAIDEIKALLRPVPNQSEAIRKAIHGYLAVLRAQAKIAAE